MDLPDELLVKIFEFVVDNNHYYVRDLQSLVNVCKQWKQIVKSNPTIRNIIRKHPEEESFVDYRNLLNVLIAKGDDMFENVVSLGVAPYQDDKKNNLPLAVVDILTQDKPTMMYLNTKSIWISDIQNVISMCNNLIHLDLHIENKFSGYLEPFINVIRSRSRELNSMELVIESKCICDELVDALALNCYPSLETFSLCHLDDDSDDETDEEIQLDVIRWPQEQISLNLDITKLDKSMPNLIHLNFESIILKLAQQEEETTRFVNLESLSLRYCKSFRKTNIDDIFQRLAYGSSRLKSLNVTNVILSPVVLINIPTRCLQKLVLSDIHPKSRHLYSKVIGRFANTLEKVEFLSIKCSTTIRNCLQALVDELRESRLTKLNLCDSSFKPNDLLKFLEYATQVKQMKIYGLDKPVKGFRYYSMKKLKDELIDIISTGR